MRDPNEGVAPDGTLVTGVRDGPLPAPYAEVVRDAVGLLRDRLGGDLHSVHLYGSVATGQARPPESDVDLVALLHHPRPVVLREVAALLSRRHAEVVREVAIGAGDLAVLDRDDAVGRAERAFLRHYCRCLFGADPTAGDRPYRASVDLAVGFNGDLGTVLADLRPRLEATTDPDEHRRLAARAARKLLMSAATLLSAREGGWSTDRTTAVELVSRHAPDLQPLAAAALVWCHPEADAPDTAVDEVVAGLGGWLVAEYDAAR